MNTINAARTAAHADPLGGPTDFDDARLRHDVIAQYERVAAEPGLGAFHFQLGADYAARALGYAAAELAQLPKVCTQCFAGVGNPLLAGVLPRGAVVLDHACGAGMDLLLAARRVGPQGAAIGVDISPALRECARRAAEEAVLAQRVEIVAGSLAALPLPSASIDVVLSNGALNLAPDRRQVLREAWRVLRPGGALLLADVVLARPLDALARANPALRAAGIGGAIHVSFLPLLMLGCGFEGVRTVARHDPFAGTARGAELGRGFGISSVTLSARKRA